MTKNQMYDSLQNISSEIEQIISDKNTELEALEEEEFVTEEMDALSEDMDRLGSALSNLEEAMSFLGD